MQVLRSTAFKTEESKLVSSSVSFYSSSIRSLRSEPVKKAYYQNFCWLRNQFQNCRDLCLNVSRQILPKVYFYIIIQRIQPQYFNLNISTSISRQFVINSFQQFALLGLIILIIYAENPQNSTENTQGQSQFSFVWCQFEFLKQNISFEIQNQKDQQFILRNLSLNIKNKSLKMQFKNMLGFVSDSAQNQSCFPQLSWNQRIIGFAICCLLGYVIQILSFGAFISIVTGNPAKFAIIYSFGNVLALAATGFLIGFRKQCTNMADKQRRITSSLFIGALLGTLFAALVLESRILVIICLVVQIPSYIWYCATYIPFARDCIKSCLRGCFNKLKK